MSQSIPHRPRAAISRAFWGGPDQTKTSHLNPSCRWDTSGAMEGLDKKARLDLITENLFETLNLEVIEGILDEGRHHEDLLG